VREKKVRTEEDERVSAAADVRADCSQETRLVALHTGLQRPLSRAILLYE